MAVLKAEKGKEFFLAYGCYRKGKKMYTGISPRKFLTTSSTKEMFYMYPDSAEGARILPHRNMGTNIVVDVVEVEEGFSKKLAQQLGKDLIETYTKDDVKGFLMIDQPFGNGVGIVKGCMSDIGVMK